MRTALSEAACASTYEDMQLMLYKLAWRYSSGKKASEFEDALSVAHVGFMEAYRSYDRSKGTEFSTWCYHWVRGLLLNRWNEEQLARQKASAYNSYAREQLEQKQAKSDQFQLFLEGLSEEALTVAKHLVEAPSAIHCMIDNPKADGLAIARAYLHGLGIPGSVISSTLLEIRRAL